MVLCCVCIHACIKKFYHLCFQPLYSYVDGDGTVPSESAKVLADFSLLCITLSCSRFEIFTNFFGQNYNAFKLIICWLLKIDAYGSSSNRKPFVLTM